MTTRTMDTEVDVANPGLILVPGMYAEVVLNVDRKDHTLAVPLDAVEGIGDPRLPPIRLTAVGQSPDYPR